jgi:anti-sigma factor RsiW
VLSQQRHCTNEELSAYLDGQLLPEEQAACEAHLRTCEQCQQALATLRATVALLHALPRPQLPRSFVLPMDSAAPIAPVSSRRAPIYAAPLHAAPASLQCRRWPKAALITLRTVGALAAVFGIFFLLSSITFHRYGGATESSVAMPSNGPTQPQATQAGGSGLQTPNAIGTFAPQTPVPSPAAVKPSTPGGAIQTTGPTGAPGGILPDLSTATGRLQVGLFLLVLAALSYLVLRWQRTRAG